MLCRRCQPGAISAQRWSYQLGLEDGVRSPLCRIFPQVLLIVIEKLCQLFHLRGAFIVETQECFLVIKDSNMVEPKEKLDLFIWALTSFLFSSHLHFNLAADWLSVFDRKYCHWHFQVTSLQLLTLGRSCFTELSTFQSSEAKISGEDIHWFTSKPIRCGYGQGCWELGSFLRSSMKGAERGRF